MFRFSPLISRSHANRRFGLDAVSGPARGQHSWMNYFKDMKAGVKSWMLSTMSYETMAEEATTKHQSSVKCVACQGKMVRENNHLVSWSYREENGKERKK